MEPNGIILYAASSVYTIPDYYFALYLENGHLVFSMETSDPQLIKNQITSNLTYNDAQWWEVCEQFWTGSEQLDTHLDW